MTPPVRREGPERYRTIDAWRGVACLMVIAYHSTLIYASSVTPSGGIAVEALRLFPYGKLGVTLFFVISGYCICAAADRARYRQDRVRTFFLRRFRRIYPPLWAVIVLSIAFFLVVDWMLWPGLLSHEPWMQPRPWWYSPSQWVGNLTLTETWRHYVWGGPRAHFPGQAWTLCYEEQFYAVTGLLLLARPDRLYPGVLAVTAATAAAVVWSAFTGVPIQGFFFDGNWFLFAIGMLVFFVLAHHNLRRRPVALALAIASVPVWVYGTLDLSVGLAFGALLLLLHPFDGRLIASRPIAPLTWCGTMCYSLYLVHQIPVKAVSAGLFAAGLQSPWHALLISLPLCTATALALGRLFFVTVERRFLNPPVEKATATSLDVRVPRGTPVRTAV